MAGGACVVGCMHGGGMHAGNMAIEVGEMHPAGMYSCSEMFSLNNSITKNNIFTTCKRSLGQGNIFRSMCQSFCPQVGGEGWGSMHGGGMHGGGHLWWRACMVGACIAGDMHGRGMCGRGHA